MKTITDWIEIDGKEIPLLEPPHRDNDTPRRILDVLFKHKVFITAAFLVVSLPVLLYLLLKPAQYLAISKVLVKPSRAFLGVSPTSGERPFSFYPSPEMINSEIQIITSRELRERLNKEIPFPKENSGNTRGGSWLLQAAPIRQSDLIQISVKSSNPQLAARVVNRAAELYLEQHVKVHKTPGVEEFYDQQDKTLQIELTNAETALKEFLDKEKIVDAGSELSSSLGRLAAFETNLRTTESSIREINEKTGILERQLKEQRPTISSSAQVSINPIYDRMRDKLIQLELERDSLLQRYTPNDRLVSDKEKEIADLNKKLANILSDPKAVWSTNPVHQGILNSLLTARAELSVLEARRSSLLKQIATYSSSAAELKKKSFVVDRLQREANAKKEALSLYKRKAEEARISDAMDERKFSNAYILERATLPLQRAGVALWIMLLITVLGSVAIAVAGAFAIEFFNTSLKNEADVEEQIGLPVLATIQYYRLPERV